MRAYRLITSPDSIASSKLRLYLRWKNIPFRETIASRQVIKSEVAPRIKGVDVPVLITPSNEAYQDSRAMVDYLETRETRESLVPERAELRFAARLIEAFCDDWLANAVTLLIWARESATAPGILARTLYPDQSDDQNDRIARTLASRVTSKLARRGFETGALGDTKHQIEVFLTRLERHLERSPFLLGDAPCIADLAIAAALTTLRDSSPDGAAVIMGTPRVFAWLGTVNGPGGPHNGALRRAYGVPDTMIDILRIAAAHFIPNALEASEAVADWADSNPGRINLPKVVGHSRREGHDQARELNPQSQYLLQRIIEPLEGEMSVPVRDALKATLEQIGCTDLMGYVPRRTVRHEHFRMRVDLHVNPDATSPDIRVHDIAEHLLHMRQESSETRDLERLVVG